MRARARVRVAAMMLLVGGCAGPGAPATAPPPRRATPIGPDLQGATVVDSAAPTGFVLRCGPGVREAYAKEAIGPLTGGRWQFWPDVLREAHVRGGWPQESVDAAATAPLPSDPDDCAFQCAENGWKYLVEVSVTFELGHVRVKLENRLPYFQAAPVEEHEEATADELYRAVPRALSSALRRLHTTWGDPPHELQAARKELKGLLELARNRDRRAATYAAPSSRSRG